MEMFLMGLCLSLLGVAVSAIAFGAATRDDLDAPSSQPQPRPSPPRPVSEFFLRPDVAFGQATHVPVEVLLLQLERHVRLEQAAAETFLSAPTFESLHSRTTSPLVH